MHRYIIMIIAALLLLATSAAAQIGTNDIADDFAKLSDVERAEVALLLAEKANAPMGISPQTVEPWLALVDRFVEGTLKFAKGIGVEANELIKTPVGIIIAAGLLYHIMGPDVLDIVIGFAWLGITIPLLLLFFFKGVIPITEYKEAEVKGWRGMRVVAKPIRRRMDFSGNGDELPGVDYWFMGMVVVTTIVFVSIIG